MIKSKQEWQDERIADIILECADVIRDGCVPDADLLYEMESILCNMEVYQRRKDPCSTLVNGYLDKFRPQNPLCALPEDMCGTVGLESEKPETTTEETETSGTES